MNNIISLIKLNQTMWYPACGNDLRPFHHVAFNNLYINPRYLILNDDNPDLYLDLSVLEQIPEVTIISSQKTLLFGVEITAVKLYIEFNNVKHTKNLLFFPICNFEMFELLLKHKINPFTVLLHCLKDDGFRQMEISWLEAFRTLNVRYCYTDNWYNLSLKNGGSLCGQPINQGLRYISNQSYSGFKFSHKDMNLESGIAMNNCFDSMIHLFEIK
jgi:hypothetical protein